MNRDRKPLPTAPPEQLGIPSSSIRAFLDELQARNFCMHGVMMLRHGRVAAEMYWHPYDAERLHRMYSCSKSFVSVAIGCLEEEGQLSLDDKVAQFFPAETTVNSHPYVAQTTIRDLLLMAAPHYFGKVTYGPRDPDWAATFFNTPPTHLPGKIFSYDTTATVILTILVERIAGKPFLEYLRPRLFDPMGCSVDMACIQTPCGHSWGGSGVLCTLRDFAKFALVCMQQGRHDGQQLLPAAYLRQATGRQIDNQVAEAVHEHIQGYGYQFWRISRHGFACLGMGCQLAICLPEQDFILITTADLQGVPTGAETIFNALWQHIFPRLAESPLPPDPTALAALSRDVQTLRLPVVAGKGTSPVAAQVNGRRFVMTPGELPIQEVRFDFEDDRGVMEYVNDTGRHRLGFAFGRQHRQEFPETHYSGLRIGTPMERGYECYSSAAWVRDNSLAIRVWITDCHIGNLKINVVFDPAQGTVTLLMAKAAEWFLEGYSGFVSGYMVD